jgi:hypothetical protein
VLAGRHFEHLLGPKDLVVVEDTAGAVLGDADRDAERMVWRREPRLVLEPADERLRVGDSDADVDGA